MTDAAILMEGVSKAYDGRRVVDGVDLEVARGEVLALMGPSGGGKTTLLRMMNGLTSPDEGTVRVGGVPLRYENDRDLPVRRDMAYILQKPVSFASSVHDNVAYALRVRGVQELGDRVERSLETVGLSGLSGQMAPRLSGGEMQRMAFARATVFEPSILLLDEFTANLDPRNVALLERAALRFHEEGGATLVIVTHNLFQARRISDRAALMIDGALVEVGPTEEVFERPRDERTRAFVSGEMVF